MKWSHVFWIRGFCQMVRLVSRGSFKRLCLQVVSQQMISWGLCIVFVITLITPPPVYAAMRIVTPMVREAAPPPAPDAQFGAFLSEILSRSAVASHDDLKRWESTLAELVPGARARLAAEKAMIAEYGLGEKIAQRHDEFITQFEESLAALERALQDGPAAIATLDLGRNVRKSRPFAPNQLWYPAQDTAVRKLLTEGPMQTPSAPKLSGKAVVLPADEAAITPAIQQQADALGNDPLAIYLWVKNSIAFLPTFGAMQAAEDTLASRSGNAADIASLLISLLRASGIEARYVAGVVDAPADRVVKWIPGSTDAFMATDLMIQGGIPTQGLSEGGILRLIRFQHVWVEARLDYVPSRGRVNRTPDTWIPLDASMKRYETRERVTMSQAILDQAQVFRDDIAGLVMEDPLGGITATYPDYLRTRFNEIVDSTRSHLIATNQLADAEAIATPPAIAPVQLPAFPASLESSIQQVFDRFDVLPDSYRSIATVSIPSAETVRIPLSRLGTRRLSLEYRPATEQDQAVIDAVVDSGGTELPLQLIRAVPTLLLDNEVLTTGGALKMGTDQRIDLSLQTPFQAHNAFHDFDAVVGDVIALGINAHGVTQEAFSDRLNRGGEPTAAENMHVAMLLYWFEVDATEKLLAAGRFSRPVVVQRLPSAGAAFNNLSVSYFFGVPRSGSYRLRSVDVPGLRIAAAATTEADRLGYVDTVGWQSSYLEGAVLDQAFNRAAGVSATTTQVFLDAATQDVPLYEVTSANATEVLAQVSAPAAVITDVRNAVNAGYQAVIPGRMVRDVAGYLIRDPVSGSAAYRIDFGLNGSAQGDCEPQPEPISISISDIILTLIIMAIVAIAIATALPSGGTSLAGAQYSIAAIALSMGVTSLAFSSNAYAADPDRCCIPIPTPPRGNDPIHDACAAIVPPNEFGTDDVIVDGKSFDAISNGGSILWEVKTFNSQNCVNTQSFPCRDIIWGGSLGQLATQSEIAAACDYDFNILIGDPVYGAFLTASGVGLPPDLIVIDPMCIQPTRP